MPNPCQAGLGLEQPGAVERGAGMRWSLRSLTSPTYCVIPVLSPPFRGSAFPNPRHSAKRCPTQGCTNLSLCPPNQNPRGVRWQPGGTPKRTAPRGWVQVPFLLLLLLPSLCSSRAARGGAARPSARPAPEPSRAGLRGRGCGRASAVPAPFPAGPGTALPPGPAFPFPGAAGPGGFPGGSR